MGVGVGIVLIAAGAILTFAVHAAAGGVDLHTVGEILMAVGAFGVLVSVTFWSSWFGPGRSSHMRGGYYQGPPRLT